MYSQYLGGGGKRIGVLGTSTAVSYLVRSKATGDPFSKKSNPNHKRGAHLIPLLFPVSVPHLMVHSIHSRQALKKSQCRDLY